MQLRIFLLVLLILLLFLVKYTNFNKNESENFTNYKNMEFSDEFWTQDIQIFIKVIKL